MPDGLLQTLASRVLPKAPEPKEKNQPYPEPYQVNSNLITSLHGKLTGWQEPYGRSFTMVNPFGGRSVMFIAQDDPNKNGSTVQHERDHVRAQALGQPQANIDMKESIPAPIMFMNASQPAQTPPTDIASNIQSFKDTGKPNTIGTDYLWHLMDQAKGIK